MRARRRPPPALPARPARLIGGGCPPPALSSSRLCRRLHAPRRSPPTGRAACPRARHALGFLGRLLSCALHASRSGHQEMTLPSRTATQSARALPCLHALALRRRIQVRHRWPDQAPRAPDLLRSDVADALLSATRRLPSSSPKRLLVAQPHQVYFSSVSVGEVGRIGTAEPTPRPSSSPPSEVHYPRAVAVAVAAPQYSISFQS